MDKTTVLKTTISFLKQHNEQTARSQEQTKYKFTSLLSRKLRRSIFYRTHVFTFVLHDRFPIRRGRLGQRDF